MLVLSRRIGESIVIGGNIRVTITSIQGNRVKVGIEAPDSVRVDRSEIHERVVPFVAEPGLEAAALR